MSASREVKVRATETNEILFECALSQIESAYEFASQMEKLDIAVKVEAPGAAMSLATALGANKDEIDDLKNTLDEEIEDHNI